jgi:uncharacterized glyoxalase superfamily protein PhnB
MTSPVLIPRLVVSDAGAALLFYQKVFDATELERYASPGGTVVHSAIDIGGAVIAVVDEAPDWGIVSPDSLSGSPVLLNLEVDDPDATARAVQAAGGTILIPVDDRFYGRREGRVRDPFGHLWILGRQSREVTPEEIQRGVDAFGG